MKTVEKYSFRREKDGEWCKATLELREQKGGLELSITGDHGYILDEESALEEAKQYWVSFFEECPEELTAMGERFGREFKDEEEGAEFVLEVDGDFHGLDVDDMDGDKVYVTTSCGQIREEIGEYFPEIVSLFPYHLNQFFNQELPQVVIERVRELEKVL